LKSRNNIIDQSVKYNYLISFFSKSCSFIISIIIARILFPEDFGILLLADIFNRFLTVFTSIGITGFYFQKEFNDQKNEIEILNTTAYYTVIIFLFVSFLQMLTGFILINIFSKPLVGQVLLIYSIGMILTIPISIKHVACKKHFYYRTISMSKFWKDLTGSPFKLIFALNGLGPLSIPIGHVIGKFFQLLYLFFQKKITILPFSIKHNKIYSRDVIFYGKHGLLTSFASILNSQIDKIFFTSLFPMYQIGLMSFSTKYTMLPREYLLAPQRNLKKSLYVSIKTKLDDLKIIIKNINTLTSTLLTPIYVFLFIESPMIISFVFGEKWIESIPFFRLYIINNLIFSHFETTNGLLISLGYPEIVSRLKLIRTPIIFIILFIATKFNPSLYELCLIFIITNSILYLPQVIVSLKKVEIKFLSFYKCILPVFFSVFLTTIIYLLLRNKIFFSYNIILLMINTIIYFGIYLIFNNIFSSINIKQLYKSLSYSS